MSVTMERIKELRLGVSRAHSFINGIMLEDDEATALLDLAERSLTGGGELVGRLASLALDLDRGYATKLHANAVRQAAARISLLEEALRPFAILGASGNRVLQEDEREGAEVRATFRFEDLGRAASILDETGE